MRLSWCIFFSTSTNKRISYYLISVRKLYGFYLERLFKHLSAFNDYSDLFALHNDVNPTDKYQIFSQLLTYAKNKHLSTKTVKYNKKKHYKSKWISGATLKSINTKDKLYKHWRKLIHKV